MLALVAVVKGSASPSPLGSLVRTYSLLLGRV